MNSSILGLLLAAVAVQTPSASVVGTVRDTATGEPVPGAEVTLTDLDRGVADRRIFQRTMRVHPMLAGPDCMR